MKFMKQFGIILAVTFLGEALKYVIPLPIPASIYGLVLMLLALCTGILKLDQVKEADISDRDHADDVYSGGRRADGFLGTDQRDLRTAYSGHVDHNSRCHGGNRTCDTVYHTKGRQGGRWTRCLVPLYSSACL